MEKRGLWNFAWMTYRSPELVRVCCAAAPTSWGLQHPDPTKFQRAEKRDCAPNQVLTQSRKVERRSSMFPLTFDCL